jgi:ubiquitin-protein ligase
MQALSNFMNSTLMQSNSERQRKRVQRLQKEFSQMKSELPKGNVSNFFLHCPDYVKPISRFSAVKFRFHARESMSNFDVLLPKPISNSGCQVAFRFIIPDRYPFAPPKVTNITGPEV